MTAAKPVKIKDIAYISLFASLIAASAFLKIPFVIPFTMQTFAVFFSTLFIGMNRSLISLTVYVLLGLCGVPIFTGGGGIGYLLYPTFGYILGFYPCVLVCGFLLKKIQKKNFVKHCLILAVSLLPLYIFGISYMYLVLKFYTGAAKTVSYVLFNGFIIFLPAEAAKIAVAVYCFQRLERFKLS